MSVQMVGLTSLSLARTSGVLCSVKLLFNALIPFSKSPCLRYACPILA
jgi:hypothetical protein